ncbi:MAG: hypothetical protein ACYC4Q_11065 [Victivallaceae bacterium]
MQRTLKQVAVTVRAVLVFLIFRKTGRAELNADEYNDLTETRRMRQPDPGKLPKCRIQRGSDVPQDFLELQRRKRLIKSARTRRREED